MTDSNSFMFKLKITTKEPIFNNMNNVYYGYALKKSFEFRIRRFYNYDDMVVSENSDFVECVVGPIEIKEGEKIGDATNILKAMIYGKYGIRVKE